MGTEIKRLTAQQDLSAAALSESFALESTKDFKLLEVLISFDGAVTETVSVVYDSGAGAAYDTTLATSDLSAESKYVFRPTGECIFKSGDAVLISGTAATATETASVTVLLEDVYGG